MTLKEIKELIRIVQNAKISEISVEKDKFKIQIKTGIGGAPAQVITAPAMAVAPVIAAPAPVAAQQSAAAPAAKTETAAKDDGKYTTIKSPMIGTFYRSSSPDKEPFVNVGDTIKQGDVLCIIEAMKLFNEIESEFSGKIVKILVDNATPVEYDQPLYLIDTKG